METPKPNTVKVKVVRPWIRNFAGLLVLGAAYMSYRVFLGQSRVKVVQFDIDQF